MMRPSIRVISLFLILFFLSAPTVLATDESTSATLSFAERVACTEKVEDVYWAHRIWPESNPGPKPPRTSIVSKQQVAGNVEASLLHEAALLEVWGEALTPEQIQAELDRIVGNTLHPELLQDVFVALDHDAYLVAECFVRPRLAERQLRDRFASDPEIHSEIRLAADSILISGASAAELETHGATVSELIWRVDGSEDRTASTAGTSAHELVVSPGELADLTERLEGHFGELNSLVGAGFSPLAEVGDGFVAIAVRQADHRCVKISSATWSKKVFETWFDGLRSRLRPVDPPRTGYTLPETKTKSFCVDNTWSPTSTTGAPGSHSFNVTIWTGAEMIVWGGGDWPGINTGGRYDLTTDTWTATSTSGAPSPRQNSAGVWTGTEMVVWGGLNYPTYYNTGGRYNPASNSWTATSTAGAPTVRGFHSAVWSGTEMVVWGGLDSSAYLDTGGRYNPVSNSWSAISMTNVPTARRFHTVVWTGTEMIVWGGSGSGGAGAIFNTGARYTPSADSWTPTSLSDVPEARENHTAVWTETEMIVWGGNGLTSGWVDTGGIYDPTADDWSPTSTTTAPEPRIYHTAVWTGTEMIVWGGGPTGNTVVDTGGRYDPAGDGWTATTTTDAPSPRGTHSSAWPGPTPIMIIWGGWDSNGPVDTGGLYCVSGFVPYDFGDAPDPTYPTLEASDGARHRLGTTLYLGSDVDSEDDGQPTATADGDDIGDRDDEDGVTFTSVANPGGSGGVDVESSEAGLLNAWIDFNIDGDWNDVGEQIFTDEALAAGINPLTFAVPAGATVGVDTVARLRVDSAGGLLPTGAASDGEVEDHLITIEELDFGDAPDPSYPTLLAFDGARHGLGGGLWLGATVDAEPDGQPTALADGDDNDGTDDEDGVVFTSVFVAGNDVFLDVTASVAGMLNAWVDFNADGDWDDAGEQVFTDQALVPGVNPLSFIVPAAASTGVATFARFRVDSGGGLSFTGEASDGEVEDHQVYIEELDFGDAPDPTFPTLLASDGARHVIGGPLFLGALVDHEPDGQPTSAASGDDTNNLDDEDGVNFGVFVVIGAGANVDVTASAAGMLNAWADFNADGDWSDPGEQIFTDQPLAAGSNPLVFTVPPTTIAGTLMTRFRVDSAGGLAPTGLAADGEVEDHAVLAVEIDYGDAPDPTYPTLVASNGAGHILGSGLLLGALVDGEPDGQPTASADGDDTSGTDDEDGVVLPAMLLAGAEEPVDVTASAPGLLNAWVDFNADGDWDDPGEQIFTDEPLAAGVNNLSTTIPLDATASATFARFRFDSAGGLTPTGLAADGEVEDYQVEILPSADLEVAISDSPDPVPEGGLLTYFVTVQNNGQIEATNVELQHTLPPEGSFVSASHAGCSETGGVVTCALGTVASIASIEVAIEANVAFGTSGGITATAAVQTSDPDPITPNNTDVEITTVVDEPTYIFSDSFETGDTSRWSLTSP